MSVLCHLCRRPIGTTTYVIEGFLGTYMECEWCYAGTDRPSEPELITDTFTTRPAPAVAGGASPARLDAIIDKLTRE